MDMVGMDKLLVVEVVEQLMLEMKLAFFIRKGLVDVELKVV